MAVQQLEAFESTPAIATRPDIWSSEDELKVDVRKLIPSSGLWWNYEASPLALPNSLHASMSTNTGFGALRSNFWLDWHDMVGNPQVARSLAFVGLGEKVAPEIQLARVKQLATSFQAYDQLMVPYDFASSD